MTKEQMLHFAEKFEELAEEIREATGATDEVTITHHVTRDRGDSFWFFLRGLPEDSVFYHVLGGTSYHNFNYKRTIQDIVDESGPVMGGVK